MLFGQLEFLLFLAFVIAFLAAVKSNRARKVMLLAASYYFYAYWDWRFCGLLLFSTGVDFLIGQGLKHSHREGIRRLLLSVSIVCNLGLLGFFKYFNFFIDSMQSLLQPLGWNTSSLHIILPVGISFYTFQTLSYTIDVYRRKLKPCDDILDFALFVSFFPQLVAGPIVRASDFLPQLRTQRIVNWHGVYWGFLLFVRGLVKKVLIADHLATVSDFTFANAGVFDGWTTWIGILCYAGQIYCDFSGYTDMAIGVARAMGYEFAPNFQHPYVSTSITEFWRRWHISLSTWLRDYLYIPLGGNRISKHRTYINLMITMLLGGLWHGASWTFVFWGFLHGCALALERMLGIERRMRVAPPLVKACGWLATMLIVLVAWVFFRAQSFTQAIILLGDMFSLSSFNEGIHWVSLKAIILLPVVAVFHVLSLTRWRQAVNLTPDRWYTPTILFLLLYLVVLFQPSEFSPFIYFQF